MKIALGCDHGGYPLKKAAADFLAARGIEILDCGTDSADSCDYPIYADAVAERVVDARADRGVLICTTGLGVCMAANRYSTIRAAVCDTVERAKKSRSHNDCNVLCLAANTVGAELEAILAAWLDTPFDGAGACSCAARHARRTAQLDRANRISDVSWLAHEDPEIYAAIVGHVGQEDSTINLIASENYTSRAVRQAQGSVLTNKYSEGYPGKRWYSGCNFVDDVERLAIDRAKELFGAEHANVQAHCGSGANMAVYFAALNPGDTILSMSLDQGGHLSHGSPVSFSGKMFNIVPYTVSRDTELLDYDAIAEQAKACKPALILAGASAYPRAIDFARFREIADSVGAILLVDMAHIAGLVAGGAHQSPVPYADFVTTTTHKTLRGPRSGLILCREKWAKAIDKAVFPGLQGGPQQHTTAAKAVCFKEAMSPEFRDYAAQIVRNAQRLATRLTDAGFRLVSGGTDNHLMLLDVGAGGLTGKDAANALDRAGIIGNKNAIPYDKNSPFVTSGVRLGTASVTTRGMKEAEMDKVAAWIIDILKDIGNEAKQDAIRTEVADLTRGFPVP